MKYEEHYGHPEHKQYNPSLSVLSPGSLVAGPIFICLCYHNAR